MWSHGCDIDDGVSAVGSDDAERWRQSCRLRLRARFENQLRSGRMWPGSGD